MVVSLFRIEKERCYFVLSGTPHETIGDEVVKRLSTTSLISLLNNNTKVQSTAHQTVHFGLPTALVSRALALISNCKWIACRAIGRTFFKFIDTFNAQLYEITYAHMSCCVRERQNKRKATFFNGFRAVDRTWASNNIILHKIWKGNLSYNSSLGRSYTDS
jgi:hypothetical protein